MRIILFFTTSQPCRFVNHEDIIQTAMILFATSVKAPCELRTLSNPVTLVEKMRKYTKLHGMMPMLSRAGHYDKERYKNNFSYREALPPRAGKA